MADATRARPRCWAGPHEGSGVGTLHPHSDPTRPALRHPHRAGAHCRPPGAGGTPETRAPALGLCSGLSSLGTFTARAAFGGRWGGLFCSPSDVQQHLWPLLRAHSLPRGHCCPREGKIWFWGCKTNSAFSVCVFKADADAQGMCGSGISRQGLGKDPQGSWGET